MTTAAVVDLMRTAFMTTFWLALRFSPWDS